MIILCFWESTSYIAEAINLSLACSVSLLYNQNSAFQDDGIVHVIRCCPCLSLIQNRGLWVSQLDCRPLLISSPACDELPLLTSSSILPLSPCRWEQPTSAVSSPLRTFQSSSAVSFTLNPALWLDLVKSVWQSDKQTPALICRCWINTVIRRQWRRPWASHFVFSAVTQLRVPPAWRPLKEATLWRDENEHEALIKLLVA